MACAAQRQCCNLQGKFLPNLEDSSRLPPRNASLGKFCLEDSRVFVRRPLKIATLRKRRVSANPCPIGQLIRCSENLKSKKSEVEHRSTQSGRPLPKQKKASQQDRSVTERSCATREGHNGKAPLGGRTTARVAIEMWGTTTCNYN